MGTVTRTTEIELEGEGNPTLQVECALRAADGRVEVDEISAVTLFADCPRCGARGRCELDLFGEPVGAMRDWLTRTIEETYADDAYEIACEIAEGLASQHADADRAYQKEHREAS
jgi:hypothetical protein